MTWILSLLGVAGVGGLGAAMFLIPSFAGSVAQVLGVIADWFVKHPWAIVVAALLVFSLSERHDATVARREVPAWKGAYATMRGAYETERGVVIAQGKAIDGQNKAIDTFAAAQAEKQKAAKEALRAAETHGRRLEADKAAIDAQRAQSRPSGQNCRTLDRVTAARGDL